MAEHLFQFTLLDDGFALAQFGTEVEHLRDALVPVELDASQAWFFDRANQTSIGGRQSDQFTQGTFVAVNTKSVIAEKVGSRQSGREPSAE